MKVLISQLQYDFQGNPFTKFVLDNGMYGTVSKNIIYAVTTKNAPLKKGSKNYMSVEKALKEFHLTTK
jgi:hypothetical protein